jgi:hypothetical protein
MKKTITTCDVCKEEKECVQVLLNFNSPMYRGKIFDICNDCCVKAKLFEDKPHFQYESPKTTAEQLFDLIGEIARNAVEE